MIQRPLVWLTGTALMAALLVGCNGSSNSNAGATTTGGAAPTTAGSTPTETGGNRPASPGPGAKIDGDTVKIGLVASLTGDLLPWGNDSAAGCRLAVKEINAKGGINGKKVELFVEDSASDPKQGKSATDILISKGVVGIVGEVASGITAQIANSAFDAGLPVVAVGATRTDITKKGSNIFRVCYTDDFQGPVMAKFAYEELNLRSIAVMTDTEQPYSTGLSETFKKYFEKLGGKIITEEFYKTKDAQFTSQLTNIKSKNPDGMFLSGYFTEVGLIARQAKEAGLKVKLLGGDGWDSSDILTGGGEGIVGGFFCNHYNSQESRPEVKNFLTKWKAEYAGKEPGTTMGALGYDAMTLMMDAISRAKTPDSKGVIDALEETENFASVSGVITLKGQNGDPPKRALVVEIRPEGQVYRKAYEFFK